MRWIGSTYQGIVMLYGWLICREALCGDYLILSSLDLKTKTVTSGRSNADWPFIDCDLISGQTGLQVRFKKTCGQPYSATNTNALLAKALMWRWDQWTLSRRYDSLFGSSMYPAPRLSSSSRSSSTLYVLLVCLGWPIIIRLLIWSMMLNTWPRICEHKSNSQYWVNLSISTNQLTLRHWHIVIGMPCWWTWLTASSVANGFHMTIYNLSFWISCRCCNVVTSNFLWHQKPCHHIICWRKMFLHGTCISMLSMWKNNGKHRPSTFSEFIFTSDATICSCNL